MLPITVAHWGWFTESPSSSDQNRLLILKNESCAGGYIWMANKNFVSFGWKNIDYLIKGFWRRIKVIRKSCSAQSSIWKFEIQRLVFQFLLHLFIFCFRIAWTPVLRFHIFGSAQL